MAVSGGDKVPSVNFKMLTADGLSDVSSDDYFGGKKTALFAVPGAFTPTCSAKHVPSFLAQADALKAKGVDQIACVSVNDAFVMKAWGADTGSGDTIDMLADGNGEFARATGLTLDARGFGLGERTTRFSMIVDDGTITALNVEENPTEMVVSSAEHMLTQPLIRPSLAQPPAKGACAAGCAPHIVVYRWPPRRAGGRSTPFWQDRSLRNGRRAVAQEETSGNGTEDWRRSTQLHGRHHRGLDRLSRLDRRRLGDSFLPSQGLHAGLHHRARLHGGAQVGSSRSATARSSGSAWTA